MLKEINSLIIDIYQKSLSHELVNFRDHVCDQLNKILPFDSMSWHYINAQGKTLSAICSSPLKAENCQCDNLTSTRKNSTKHYKSLVKDDHPTPKNSVVHYQKHQLNIIFNASEAKPGHQIQLNRNETSASFTSHEQKLLELVFPHLVEGFSIVLRNRFKDNNDTKVTAIIDKYHHIVEANPAFFSSFSKIIKQKKLLLNLAMQPQQCIHNGLKYRVTQIAEFYIINSETNTLQVLTQQEHKIMKYVTTGASNKVIAETLQLSPSTVNNHLTHIFHKLNVNNRISAIKLWGQYDNK